MARPRSLFVRAPALLQTPHRTADDLRAHGCSVDVFLGVGLSVFRVASVRVRGVSLNICAPALRYLVGPVTGIYGLTRLLHTSLT